MGRADELATPGLMRQRTCVECSRRYEEPARPCMPTMTCSDACRHLRIRRQKRDAKRRATRKAHVELLRHLPPDDRGPTFSLSPGELAELLQAHEKGWTVEALSVRFGVSTRTVQRALRLGPPEYVKIGRYGAWFAPQRTGTPVQLTDWYREKAMDALLREPA